MVFLCAMAFEPRRFFPASFSSCSAGGGCSAVLVLSTVAALHADWLNPILLSTHCSTASVCLVWLPRSACSGCKGSMHLATQGGQLSALGATQATNP